MKKQDHRSSGISEEPGTNDLTTDQKAVCSNHAGCKATSASEANLEAQLRVTRAHPYIKLVSKTILSTSLRRLSAADHYASTQ